ncbi:neurogenic locus notch homolog protein 3-like [Dreissena polymorpha]|uniref:neurogenic locus notch homolog protein 3-like n=1 Tax=Dreissena polymorpha TaxID=45954 RepID=UPI002264B0AA|nr:neurogenic locus notch homolog protein 3-like [Dreissena polymorpha]
MNMQGFIHAGLFLLTVTNVCNTNSCFGKACLTNNLCVDFHDQCICNVGYTLNSTTGDCDDLDECANHYHDPCGHRGSCTNSVGSYFCNCLYGWTNDTHCIKKVHDCPLCMPGYEGSRCGYTVCEHGFAEPVGMNDLSCVCNPGWQKRDGPKSPCNIDVNECLLSDVCDKTQMCINTNGSYMCQSHPSWTENNSDTDNKDIVAVLPDRILLYILFGLLCLMLLIIILLSHKLCHRTRERSKRRNVKAPEQLRTIFGCVQYFI